ncbi:hypothetical protein GDO81_000682 [Engystomops pustulosus]|uniref:Secreted protein n=1 Tax=Engystomops pustulosus TaxID=76066 RepID=A0AAV7D9P3_ENGPU|nr:hypothetical protein GDO81_000682 [Engystomops pustulosus]
MVIWRMGKLLCVFHTAQVVIQYTVYQLLYYWILRSFHLNISTFCKGKIHQTYCNFHSKINASSLTLHGQRSQSPGYVQDRFLRFLLM